jgi:diaminopropionate ammonia-lyase
MKTRPATCGQGIWDAYDQAALRVVHNAAVERGIYPVELRGILSSAAAAKARRVITGWPGYAPTPLVDLKGLARELDIARLGYKNEAARFGLGSFKALGGAYGVYCMLCRAQSAPSSSPHGSTELTARADEFVVTTATDGNHGRSVAWGARLFGCRAVVFVHERVSSWRVEQIGSYGAKVVLVAGTYDDAVRAARDAADANGWLLVSDTSGPENLPITRDVMAGYTLLIHEALEQFGMLPPPTHVLVQAGVGGLAAALLAYLWELLGADRPRLVVVEPERADCLFQSACQGRPVAIGGDLHTLMAGLSCGEPSYPAWQLLSRGADAFCTVPDSIVAPTMRLLAAGSCGDPHIVAGESAVAGLAALTMIARSPALRESCALTPDSGVLLIGTEGATDVTLYRALVGESEGGEARV